MRKASISWMEGSDSKNSAAREGFLEATGKFQANSLDFSHPFAGIGEWPLRCSGVCSILSEELCSLGHTGLLSPSWQGRRQTQGCSQLCRVLLLRLLESKLSEVIAEMEGDWEDRGRGRAGSVWPDHWVSYYLLIKVTLKEKLTAGGDSRSIFNPSPPF